MPQLIDQYFLVETRDKKFVLDFLDRYLPDRKAAAADYPMPLYEEPPTVTFSAVEEALAYLQNNTGIEYSIYWRNLHVNPLIQHAMAFYTNDGKLILGVSLQEIHADGPESLRNYWALRDFLAPKASCITSEEPPPANAEEFYGFAQNRFPNESLQ